MKARRAGLPHYCELGARARNCPAMILEKNWSIRWNMPIPPPNSGLRRCKGQMPQQRSC